MISDTRFEVSHDSVAEDASVVGCDTVTGRVVPNVLKAL
jgi:hypothetical protein